MGLTRRHRRWLSSGLVLLLLTLQWAVAAHACARVLTVPAMALQAMPCCDEADDGDGAPATPTALCRAHCDGPAPSVQSPSAAADVPALVDAGAWWPVAALPLAGPVGEPAAARAAADPAPRGSPPRYLTLRVLRR